MAISAYLSTFTLNVNVLNALIKSGWMDKSQDPYICHLQETRFRSKDTNRLKVRGWKKVFHANGNKKKARVAILVSGKINFKTKTVTRDNITSW